MLITDLSDSLNEGCRRHKVASLTLNRLHDDCCNFIRTHKVIKELLQIIKAKLCALPLIVALRAQIRLGVGGKIDAWNKGLIGMPIFGSRACDGGSPEGTPMERAPEGNDAWPPRIGTSELEGAIGSLGSAI